ncbi:TetR family transcriptional regulator [Streptomyces sp. ME02-6987-2C]|uniref:TetR/AcrR family transcriptional regulator n=1 Tax=unclassified Streptomyces TaxID=2593676 RepID=UPI0029ABDD92|nr:MULTISPECIES: TetR family transcriptional regulator [unclassified Streptomyces]MDX3367853.1 TetR family transcriptional regulator [Streptomyces sp. ME02-6987-2C]MDX3426904.1 TetR family transcriptional regulator [Streptomyces sp. ME02-6985-2c]
MTDRQTAPRGGRRLRSDSLRNRRRLLQAVGELAREAPDQLTMQAVAARAEIGPATAYRYYSSMDDVLAAYVLSVVEELRDFSVTSAAQGRPLFDAVVDKWVDLLAEHGAALVQLRSRRGYLERLHDGNEIIVAQREAWSRPVRGLLQDIGLPDEMFEYALFLNNMIFDPREIHDLLRETSLSRREVITRLTEAYGGALSGWSRAG